MNCLRLGCWSLKQHERSPIFRCQSSFHLKVAALLPQLSEYILYIYTSTYKNESNFNARKFDQQNLESYPFSSYPFSSIRNEHFFYTHSYLHSYKQPHSIKKGQKMPISLCICIYKLSSLSVFFRNGILWVLCKNHTVRCHLVLPRSPH